MSAREFDKIAHCFDAYIEWPKRLQFETPFLISLLKQAKAKSVLDIGCGSGHHAVQLAKAGYDVVGIDPSDELLDKARQNARMEGVIPQFVLAELEDLRPDPGCLMGHRGPLHGRHFDACLLLGNTVAFLGEDDDITWYFELIRKAMNSKGFLVIQMPNYHDRIKRRDPSTRFRSGIIDGEYSMIIKTLTYYEKSSGPPLVVLHMLRIRRNGREFTLENNAVPIRALSMDYLQKLLWAAGYLDVRFYGSMDGREFDPGYSPDCIAVAKPG
ncbi:MAG TPA: class I SAM-dependent methyltransferase [Firmicutes bacterium]|nr:class I SAM-dependent methyltransferase [Bacillota bacterium]